MDWLTTLKGSIPKHSTNIADCLEYAINTYDHSLSEIDVHGCALAAAIASGNGGLADEIAMNSPLFSKPEREAAKSAAATASVNDVLYTFDHVSREFYNCRRQFKDYRGMLDVLCATMTDFRNVKISYDMYYLAALMVYKNEIAMREQIEDLLDSNITAKQIMGIMQIAASIAAINRIIL